MFDQVIATIWIFSSVFAALWVGRVMLRVALTVAFFAEVLCQAAWFRMVRSPNTGCEAWTGAPIGSDAFAAHERS